MTNSFTAGIVGAGNLAFNLAANLKVRGHSLKIVLSRKLTSAEALVENWRGVAAGDMSVSLPQDLDFVFLTVPDHEIGAVAQQLAGRVGPETIVVHCSGSMAIEELAPFGDHTGVLWPVQTLTKEHVANFECIPLVIETSSHSTEKLTALANSLSDQVQEMDSTARCKAHMGAVFASNFANFMWIVSEELLDDPNGPGFELYSPLMQEQAKKARRFSPREVQTGPARRGDEVTIQKHLDLLKADPGLQEIYRKVSDEIGKRYS